MVSRIGETFERWGYQRIITPAFEYQATLARGLGEEAAARAMKFVEPETGEVVALRPDFTPQVARLVATRLGGQPGPLRLFYEGSVVRLGGSATPDRELFQAGIELIDAPSPAGDLEVVALLAALLQAVGLAPFTIDLGTVELARAALAGVGEPGALHQAIARKDGDEVARRARGLALPARQRRLLEALPFLCGGREVLERAAKLLSAEQPAARRGLAELRTIVEHLEALGLGDHLAIDLGEVRGFDYYTGVRFQAFAAGVGEAIASGGRYDRLVERYGRAARAAGLAVDIDGLSRALARGQENQTFGRRTALLVSGEALLSARLAALLRTTGACVVQDLAPQSGSRRRLSQVALAADLQRVYVVKSTGLEWFASDGRARGRLGRSQLQAILSGAAPIKQLLLEPLATGKDRA